MYCITKWTKHITDSGRDEYTGRLQRMRERLADVAQGSVTLYDFRLLDDDGTVYAYGKSTAPDSFAPLDRYAPDYGCTEIQYRDPATGRYRAL